MYWNAENKALLLIFTLFQPPWHQPSPLHLQTPTSIHPIPPFPPPRHLFLFLKIRLPPAEDDSEMRGVGCLLDELVDAVFDAKLVIKFFGDDDEGSICFVWCFLERCRICCYVVSSLQALSNVAGESPAGERSSKSAREDESRERGEKFGPNLKRIVLEHLQYRHDNL